MWPGNTKTHDADEARRLRVLQEDRALKALVAKHGPRWKTVAHAMRTKTDSQVSALLCRRLTAVRLTLAHGTGGMHSFPSRTRCFRLLLLVTSPLMVGCSSER